MNDLGQLTSHALPSARRVTVQTTWPVPNEHTSFHAGSGRGRTGSDRPAEHGNQDSDAGNTSVEPSDGQWLCRLQYRCQVLTNQARVDRSAAAILSLSRLHSTLNGIGFLTIAGYFGTCAAQTRAA